MPGKLSLQSAVGLVNSPVQMPRLGFGIYQSTPAVTVRSCLTALRAGYRHIDSAQYYENEAEMGEAIRQSGLDRGEIFLTTKILTAGSSDDDTYQKVVDSVKKIAPDSSGYVDLFLVHSPNGGLAARKSMWLALERAHKEGLVKAIGVSNYGIGHINQMKEYASIWPPQVNQIELHPWCQQRAIVEYCHQNKIVVQAYCPLVRNQKAEDETLNSIARKHSVTTAQVLIRYSLQKNWVALPKSDNPERIQTNADVFGFELDDNDMAELDGLDQAGAGSIVQPADNESTK